MRILILTLLLCGVSSSSIHGQIAAEAEVTAAIERLFDAMRGADGEVAASLFHPDAILVSISEQDGRTDLSQEAATAFIEAIGTPRTEIWDERISNLEVRVDGPLATAWMDYSFYLDGEFSHCGVNAFQLLYEETEWRIFHIADTRRREACGT